MFLNICYKKQKENIVLLVFFKSIFQKFLFIRKKLNLSSIFNLGENNIVLHFHAR